MTLEFFMDPWIASVSAAILFFILFALLSWFTKSEDYLLDDYTEEDAPDGVRIIERDIDHIVEKVVEKEVIKEIEVEDTHRIDQLTEDIKDIKDRYENLDDNHKKLELSSDEIIRLKEKLESELKEKEHELSLINQKYSLLKDDKIILEDSFKKTKEEKIQLDFKLSELSNKYEHISKQKEEQESEKEGLSEKLRDRNNKISNISDTLNKMSDEHTELLSKKEDLEETIETIKRNNVNAQSKLTEDKRSMSTSLQRSSKYINELKSKYDELKNQLSNKDGLIEELEITKKRAMEDRDHFSDLVDNKGKLLVNMKAELEKVKTEKQQVKYIYRTSTSSDDSGMDSYGKYYSYDIIIKEVTSAITNKLESLYETLDADQIGYYVYNVDKTFEETKIFDRKDINMIFDKFKKYETELGKYRVYIIVNNKVYYKKVNQMAH